jgi:hypothetical protein
VQSRDLEAGGEEEGQRTKLAKTEGELGEDSEGVGEFSEEGGKYSGGGVSAKDSAFPEAVPVTQDEEPEMQAQPGIFTNQRGNLKVRACVTSRLSAPLHASVPAYSSLNSPRIPR